MVFPPSERQQPYGPMNHQQNRNPFLNNSQMRSRDNSRGVAGLLSSFGSGKSVGGIGSVSSGGLQKLTKTLGGVQQFLGILQSTAPLIQEYGPMVKNLPSMYRMMKAFKEISNEDEEVSEKSIENTDYNTEEDTSKSEGINISQTDKDTDAITDPPKHVNEKKSGKSTPKLYI
ncbi:VrrA/YqfQ family protein [Oceanobacillus sp. 1P07AA]|uniref:VrrA/YqfQ family protein n=1 Tax=Oceanobacillus sp. 1P07AA TaxID=3132293 RepID=UPI0039A68A31